MGVRPHVDPLTRLESGGTHVVEKDERSNHTPARKRQYPADCQPAAQIPGPAFDDQIKHGRLHTMKRERADHPTTPTRVNLEVGNGWIPQHSSGDPAISRRLHDR